MLCKDCMRHISERTQPRRPVRRRPVGTCERCGAPILTLLDLPLGAGDGTLAQLARFGLAITGDPLLELKREGL